LQTLYGDQLPIRQEADIAGGKGVPESTPMFTL